MVETTASSSIICRKIAKIAEDKISSLPDEILCQILSSFGTNEAVRTSILSKRWRYVWSSVPNLDFSDFSCYTFVHSENREKLEIKDCFKDFVNRVLHLNDVSSIRKCCFCCFLDYGPSCVNSWIEAILRRNVEEINLSFSERQLVLLPSNFFTSEKLVVLKLGPNVSLTVPASVHFPNLKILHLDQVQIVRNNVIESLLSGCPVLENFHLNRRHFDILHTLFIRSSSLKRLRVECTIPMSHYKNRDMEYKIVVETPNLEYLDLEDRMANDFHVNKMPSLCSVNLSFLEWSVADYVHSERLIKLLGMISNTKYLHLDAWFLLSIADSDYGSLPVFHNLTCLNLGFYKYGRGILPYLLESSPNLKTFILEGVALNVSSTNQLCWVPKCLLFCLQKIEFRACRANHSVKKLVEYFLTNGRVLKEMSIRLFAEPELKSEFQKELLKLPKASSKCEISFS